MSFERYPRYLYDRKPKKLPFWLGFIICIIGFFLIILSLNIYNPNLVPNELRVVSLNKKQAILLLGCDEVFTEGSKNFKELLWKGRSDTIILLGCDPFKNTLNILNIPRDTKIKLAGHGVEKINYLNSIGGPVFAKTSLEKLLRIPINHYVIINLYGINRIIDELGGILVDVPQRMQYDDRAAMLHINLFPGKQLLNGEEAIGFVRFRHDSLGDIGRIQRQQEFIRAIFKKLLDPVTFTKLPEVVAIYKKTILTDLSAKDIIKIANFVRNVPSQKQNIVILPGEFGQYNQTSYWIPNLKEINKIVKNLFQRTEDLNKYLSRKRVSPDEIKISVINGSKKDRYLGNKIANYLKEYGYTVLATQDFQEGVQSSRIYAQKANKEIALQIKRDIGNFGEVLTGNLGPPEADVTILAGDDLINIRGLKD